MRREALGSLAPLGEGGREGKTAAALQVRALSLSPEKLRLLPPGQQQRSRTTPAYPGQDLLRALSEQVTRRGLLIKLLRPQSARPHPGGSAAERRPHTCPRGADPSSWRAPRAQSCCARWPLGSRSPPDLRARLGSPRGRRAGPWLPSPRWPSLQSMHQFLPPGTPHPH